MLETQQLIQFFFFMVVFLFSLSTKQPMLGQQNDLVIPQLDIWVGLPSIL